jgi:hypothetical protein
VRVLEETLQLHFEFVETGSFHRSIPGGQTADAYVLALLRFLVTVALLTLRGCHRDLLRSSASLFIFLVSQRRRWSVGVGLRLRLVWGIASQHTSVRAYVPVIVFKYSWFQHDG